MSNSNGSDVSKDASQAPPGSEKSESGVTTKAPTEPKGKPSAATKYKPRQLPPYHVVLLNDDDHTHEYVIEMLLSLFAHPPERGYQLAQQVHTTGRAVVLTTHKEKAELKRDQIHAFGPDLAVATCAGAMSAVIEPAEK